MPKRWFLKWGEVLIVIKRLNEKNCYGQNICRTMEGASSHIRNILSWLEDKKMIKRKPGLKIRKIVLTEKGEIIANDILKLKTDLAI